MSKLHWYPTSAVGARASLGYQKREVVYAEALVSDEPWLADDDMLYAEGAFLLRLRLTPSLAWEILLAARLGVTTADTNLGTAGVFSTGLHVTI